MLLKSDGDVAIAGDRLYVVDIRSHQVLVVDKRSGTVLSTFGKAGSAEGELFQPTNIAIGPDGDLRVAFDTGPDHLRIRREPDGITLERIGELLGVTRERIRQIRERAFEKLRQAPDVKGLNGMWGAA